jgi:hypothetical protein
VPTYKDSARRRAWKEQRERAKLKRIISDSEAEGAQRWLGRLAQMMGGKPRIVETAPHALAEQPPRAVVSTLDSSMTEGNILVP